MIVSNYKRLRKRSVSLPFVFINEARSGGIMGRITDGLVNHQQPVQPTEDVSTTTKTESTDKSFRITT